ncbi:hypothetical protein GWO43_00295 [candidate division KSB1 bacterium]|nr:hypothetical protein [candidate division KSB1 bacterium]NIR68508.1 hypothetical protein [candidate division KSB1 bacterium]NIS22522.1 hypothetical protein [candidate division KSB1 bacterium]NIT69366.1 hypothetical protein [candidate division KSB1 bacterium]NIU23027.1 hypothetical protein [candidate division KSB1 bacterium]
MKHVAILLCVAIPFLLIACDQGKNGVADEQKEEYIKKIETKLLKMEDQILDLSERADNALTEDKPKFEAQLDTLAKVEKDIEKNFEELKTTEGEEWKTYKAKLDSLISQWDQLFEESRDW